MANNKDIKKDKPKKEKKKRKPVYEIQGFVLTIPEERLKEMLLEAKSRKRVVINHGCIYLQILTL